MREHNRGASSGWRYLLCTAIAALGLVAIVGSGGGFPEGGSYGPLPPNAGIEPAQVTVQVGATLTLNLSVSGTPPFTYQWRRNGVDIAGATGTSYTLVGANLADDGTRFSVQVTSADGKATASSLLQVSSMPGITFQDSEFLVSDWAVSVVTDPASSVATHAETQSATEGNPGALRIVTYDVPAGPNSVRLQHRALLATYDPAVLGAIYTMDFVRDCKRISTSTTSETQASPAFEQGGRWFAPRQVDQSCNPAWQRSKVSSALANEFDLVAGPACGAGEACPDFSGGAAPLHLGFTSAVNLPAGSAAGAIVQGIDNWSVTVWRR